MKSRLVPRAVLLAACAMPLATWADDVGNQAALHGALAKALDATIQSDIKAATAAAKVPTNAPAAAKAERVQPTREPPADVAVLDVRPDSPYCLANPSQDDGC
jgi:hypothetical protein